MSALGEQCLPLYRLSKMLVICHNELGFSKGEPTEQGQTAYRTALLCVIRQISFFPRTGVCCLAFKRSACRCNKEWMDKGVKIN